VSFSNRMIRKSVACGSVLLAVTGLHAQQKPAIRVFSASYGVNLTTAASGNATRYVKSSCDAKRSCFFAVKFAEDAFPERSSHKPKNFDFAYYCGDKLKKGHVGGESKRKILLLTCAD
jgi:hypothetical protein